MDVLRGCFWPRAGDAWQFWKRAPRPILDALVGCCATAAFRAGGATKRIQTTRRPLDSDLAMAAWVKCVTQRIYLKVSLEARANLLRLRWTRKFALGGQLDCPCDMLTSRARGVNISLRVRRMGHYILSAVDFGQDPPRFQHRGFSIVLSNDVPFRPVRQ